MLDPSKRKDPPEGPNVIAACAARHLKGGQVSKRANDMMERPAAAVFSPGDFMKHGKMWSRQNDYVLPMSLCVRGFPLPTAIELCTWSVVKQLISPVFD